MKNRVLWFFVVFVSIVAIASLSAQTIAEKKAGLSHGGSDFDAATQQQLKEVNQELREKQAELLALYAQVLPMYERGVPDVMFRDIANRISALRAEIRAIELSWRAAVADTDKGEGYALWDQAATTLEQLVIDYGSQSFVYVIPPDIGKIPLSITSSIPIPKALWGEMLELILQEHGVGIQQLNPFLRKLYPLKDNRSGIRLITNDRNELEYLPKDARIAFVISPDPADSRRVGSFLERFINPITSSYTMVGRDILLVSSVAEVQELLKLYDFVAKSRGELEYKLVPLLKVDTKEMGDILQGIFEQFARAETVQVKESEMRPGAPGMPPTPVAFRPSSPQNQEVNGLKIIPLSKVAHAVFLLGTHDEIAKAEEIIREVESQVGTARSKVVFTYRVKHADPEELGALLSKIYDVFVQERIAAGDMIAQQGAPGQVSSNSQARIGEANTTQNVTAPSPLQTIWPGFYQEGQVAINPTPITYTDFAETPVNQGRSNFLVDPKTSIVVMVVEPDLLPRLKDLLRRLDVRRLMVQLDVLLVERTIADEMDAGLNLLRIGTRAAKQGNSNSFTFDDPRAYGVCNGLCTGAQVPFIAGITDFLISRVAHDGLPAFDLAYRFLMTQENTVVHNNPSVIALNNTPANIIVNIETSISVGVLPVQTGGGIVSSGGGEAFTRSQYGVNILIKPTIHTRDDDDYEGGMLDDAPDYVTLETDIHFDDFVPTANTRPDILRRQIKNFVSVADGQTVILGGLRSKTMADLTQKIPFIGEIPGLGKLFSFTALSDGSREMFIFITPTIIKDPCEDIERVKMEQFARRPGDVPYFLCALDRARRCERDRVFVQGLQMLLGRPLQRCIPWGDDPCENHDFWRRRQNREGYAVDLDDIPDPCEDGFQMECFGGGFNEPPPRF